jgi:RNA polymerase sigma-70 factor (ECF subfamily)
MPSFSCPYCVAIAPQGGRAGLDPESCRWWARLHAPDPVRARAIAELHERLRREAAFHVRLRVRNLSGFPQSDVDDLATQAASDALLAILRKLEDYRGDSQFWTWARRFVALEAPVSVRRRLGKDRVGIARDPEAMLHAPDLGRSVHERVEQREVLRTLSDLIGQALTVRQRTVVVAVAIDGHSARVVADELHTTPGAIYKTLYEARRKLRAEVAA